MKARRALVRGESCWVVPLGKKQGFLKRVRIFGSTKEEAEQRADDKLSEVRMHGRGLADISSTHRAIVAEWRDRLTPEQMVEALTAFQERRGQTRTVAVCVADYIEAKTKADERGRAAWSIEQEKPARSRLNSFMRAKYVDDGEEKIFGDQIMGDLTPGMVEDFVSAQNGSAANYHRVLRALFSHARRHRWILKSPFEELGNAPSPDGDPKDLMTPDQFARLLRFAAGMKPEQPRREPLLAAFVLGGLAGLRTAELRRLTWSKVDLKAGRIQLDRSTTRKRGLRGRFVELEPAALAWLRTLEIGDAGERVVGLTDKNFRDARTAISRAAGIDKWSHNILRRSFASHHLALNEDSARTAAVMGHTDAGTTFAKYRVPATRAAGKAWFALTPAKVAAAK